ncbi:TadE/TadG family type IV pilus assembly protein [Gymnodinialimonas sp. 2305UL16-5]|uniref:TadE/TadG family type IV pilus assembly protein n=1 Tax=Gymnodinialimonas mytili TaxID=3126503 RepID=UPI0030A28B78
MKHLFSRFWSKSDGAVAFETVIIFPILLWAWIGSFAYFDAYRVYNTSIKATFTIADLLSRQTDPVYDSDIDRMALLLEAMVRDTSGIEMRATEIRSVGDGTFVVEWSHGTGSLADYASANVTNFVDQLPNMERNERVVLVESFIEYDPAFNIGLNNVTFSNFTLTRPRYSSFIPHEDGSHPDLNNAGELGDGDGNA